jgi:hypothetical protein
MKSLLCWCPSQLGRALIFDKASFHSEKMLYPRDYKLYSIIMLGGNSPKELKSNVTDNESAKMKTSKSTIQGDNGVATVDKKDHRRCTGD